MADMEIIITPTTAIPDFLVKDVLSKMAYVDELIAKAFYNENGSLKIQCSKKPSPKEHIDLEAKIQRCVTTLVSTTRKPKIKIHENHMDLKVPFSADPMPLLLESGQVTKLNNGLFAMGPVVASLCKYFENRLFELGFAFGAKNHRFPAMVPSDFLEKIQYFKNFTHSLSFVAHLREDLEIIEKFAKDVACDSDGCIQPPQGSLAKIGNMLSPAVCHNFYLFLANRILQEEPVIGTALGNCFRYESINLTSLERLWSFTMWEVIFVGSAPKVLDCLDRTSKAANTLMQELGLAYQVETANDPFFVGEFGTQAGFQQLYDLKHEFRAKLPYKDGSLAVGSRNYHMDFFGRSVNITLADGSTAHSGCVAFGLERMAFAFVSQYGIDPDKWPANIRQAISQGL
ncbi:MAG: hypothetical protein HQL68_12330 [Magnetococcales bacterium]|nr:hypothetical protein [Magnetococcales bacterium]